MSELNFRRIELSDREQALRCLEKSDFRGCEYTFGNNFVWRNIYNVSIAFAQGMYFCRFGQDGDIKYSFPAGGGADEAVRLLAEHCSEHGEPLVISANKQMTEQIKALYPSASVSFNRDGSDYVYLAEDLSELRGRKYHGKRNHLSRFYENNWSFEPLSDGNMDECLAMNELWCGENIDLCPTEEREEKLAEQCIVRCSFKHYSELGYIGGVIRVDGEVQAFCFGEPSSKDCFVVHVEKALRKYQGTYAAINREFVRSLGGKYRYINREDDTGAENLRKAKLSYYPAFLEEKYDIVIDL